MTNSNYSEINFLTVQKDSGETIELGYAEVSNRKIKFINTSEKIEELREEMRSSLSEGYHKVIMEKVDGNKKTVTETKLSFDCILVPLADELVLEEDSELGKNGDKLYCFSSYYEIIEIEVREEVVEEPKTTKTGRSKMDYNKEIARVLESIDTPVEDLTPYVDIETTGLDPKMDKILQVAMVIVDKKLNEKARFEWIVEYDEDETSDLKFISDDYVKEMHEKTGLWDRIQSIEAVSLKRVDREFHQVLSFLQGDSDYPIQIAGNSVRFDRDFIYEHMKKSKKLLSHRVIDISAVLGYLRSVDRKVSLENVERDHDAMSDILDCIRQAKAILDQLK